MGTKPKGLTHWFILLPQQVPEESEATGEYNAEAYDDFPDPGQGVYRLNTQVTKLHNVRGK